MSRENREAIVWEDTLSQQEKTYVVKVAAEKGTIEAYKAASKRGTLAELLNALTLEHLPNEFRGVKASFEERVVELIKIATQATAVEISTGHHKDTLSVHLQSKYQPLVDINYAKKEIKITESTWIYEFKRMDDSVRIQKKIDWLTQKQSEIKPSRLDEQYSQDEIDKIGKEISYLKEGLNLIKESGKSITTDDVMRDVDTIVELFVKHGYKVDITGMNKKSHYQFRTPYIWEEDYSHKLTKLQKRFARPINVPTRDQLNTSYSGSMVEHQIHSVLVLVGINNPWTMDWFERRLTTDERKALYNAYKSDDFKLSSSTNVLQVLHKESGNIATFYQNGRIEVTVPDDADPKPLNARIGLMPFITHPPVQDFFALMARNTAREED